MTWSAKSAGIMGVLLPEPAAVMGLSVTFALIAADGGLIASLAVGTVKPSVFITFISFGIYLLARIFESSTRGSRLSV